MENIEKNGIILLGHPRSGTTLTRRLLNGHSRIASPPETHLLSACVRFLESERTAAGVDIGALSGLNFAGISDEDVLNKLREFAFSFLEDYARREGKVRWAEKTAFDAFHIKNIQQFCGDQATFIGIVRHPLDVAMSSLKFCDSMGFYPKEMHKYICEYPHPIEAFSHSWMDVSQDLIDLSQSQSGNCRIFRYEDLVSDPKSTLSDILKFLGENFEDHLIELGLDKEKVIGFGDHKGYQRKNVHNESVGKWRNLPEYQLQKLAPLLNPMLSHFGYETLRQTKSISVFEARKQYTKGMEILAQRNFESTSNEQIKVETANQTPMHQEQKARLSVYGRVTDVRSNSFRNKTWQLNPDISTEILASSIDPTLLFSASLLTLIKRIGEDNKLLIGLCKIEEKNNKSSDFVLSLHIPSESSSSFHDIITRCEKDVLDYNVNKITPSSPSLDIVLNYHEVSDTFNADKYLSFDASKSDYALVVSIIANKESSNFKLEFSFNDAVWPEQILCDRAVSHFEIILKAAAENIHQKVEGFSLLTEEEGKLLSTLDNFDELPPPFIEQFIKQVSQRALHPAVVYENESLNYQELGMRVFSLSSLLRSKGVGHGKKVAVCLDRSTNLITALLAVMHAGGTYIPIDPDYPQLRISQILEDADPHFVLSEKKLEGKICSELKERIFFLDNNWWDPNTAYDVEPNESGDLAYIIFTSGSTGRPKGVEVRHHGLNAFLAAMSEKPGMDKNDRMLSVTTISFDIAGLELFLPLSVGATVYLAKRSDTINGNALKELFVRHKITCFQATPATYRILLANNWTGQSSLKLLCGGEAMPPDLSESLLDKCHSLWNMYGPTETTIWSTIKKVTDVLPVMPIGRPIRGTRTYILNKELCQVSIGVPGELFIAGDGIANGYYGRTDLTEKVFVPDPFADEKDAKMYRTGDLVKVLDDGDLVYLGRLDNQVKIRGYRIELGEIETAIKKMAGVEQCVVSVYEQGVQVKSLVAYLIMDKSSSDINIDSLRNYLKPLLPDYMIPSFVVVLEAFPLTPNNKVDRKALPSPRSVNELPGVDEPVINKIPTSDSHSLNNNSNDLEDKIIASWQEIMRIPNISRSDTFVGLGGDSLSYVQVTIGLEEILGIVPENWEKKSIQALSQQNENVDLQQEERIAPQLSQKEKKWNSIFTDIETTIFIRAIAIISIVFVHALPEWGVHGNTGGLFIVAGFLFAKFQFNQIDSVKSVTPILLSAWRIYLPCTIIMALLLLWKGENRPDVLLLYSNFTDPILTYWYVQVLLQILIFMALLFAIKPIFVFTRNEPYKFGLLLLLVASLMMILTPFVLPEHNSYRQLPQVRLWQFVIGWCIYFSDTNIKRMATAHVLALIAVIQFFLMDRHHLSLADPIITIFFGMILITQPKVSIFKPLKQFIYALAGASLFIFLSHREFFALTHYAINSDKTLVKALAFVIALIGGYLLWKVWDLITNYRRTDIKEL